MSGLVGGVYSVWREDFLKTFPFGLESPPRSRTLLVRGEYILRRLRGQDIEDVRGILFLSRG